MNERYWNHIVEVNSNYNLFSKQMFCWLIKKQKFNKIKWTWHKYFLSLFCRKSLGMRVRTVTMTLYPPSDRLLTYQHCSEGAGAYGIQPVSGLQPPVGPCLGTAGGLQHSKGHTWTVGQSEYFFFKVLCKTV